MIKYPPEPQLVRQALEHYQSENEQLQPLLLFYEKVYEIQRNRIDCISSVQVKSTAEMSTENADQPLLKENCLIISDKEIRETIGEIVDKAYTHLSKQDMLASVSDKKILELTDLVITERNMADYFCIPDYLSVDSLQELLLSKCEENDFTSEQLALAALIVRLAVQTYYVAYSRQAQEFHDFSAWTQGICPVCGQHPMIGLLQKDDGKRVLECGLCHTQWDYPRLQCTKCGNSKQESLGFFYHPDNKQRRVYFCRECKAYLKTVVLKDTFRKIIGDLENEATLYLDVLAQREGYCYTQNRSEVH